MYRRQKAPSLPHESRNLGIWISSRLKKRHWCKTVRKEKYLCHIFCHQPVALWCGGAHGVVFVLDVVSHEVLLDQQLLDNWLKHCVDWLVIEAE